MCVNSVNALSRAKNNDWSYFPVIWCQPWLVLAPVKFTPFLSTFKSQRPSCPNSVNLLTPAKQSPSCGDYLWAATCLLILEIRYHFHFFENHLKKKEIHKKITWAFIQNPQARHPCQLSRDQLFILSQYFQQHVKNNVHILAIPGYIFIFIIFFFTNSLLSPPASYTKLCSHFLSALSNISSSPPCHCTWRTCAPPHPLLPLVTRATWIERDKWICEELEAKGLNARKEKGACTGQKLQDIQYSSTFIMAQLHTTPFGSVCKRAEGLFVDTN